MPPPTTRGGAVADPLEDLRELGAGLVARRVDPPEDHVARGAVRDRWMRRPVTSSAQGYWGPPPAIRSDRTLPPPHARPQDAARPCQGVGLRLAQDAGVEERRHPIKERLR